MLPAVNRRVIGLVIGLVFIGVFAVALVVVAGGADRQGEAAADKPPPPSAQPVPDRFIRTVVRPRRRTPADGPNVTTAGPRLGPWQDIPPERGRPVDPAPGAARFFFQMHSQTDGGGGGRRLVSVALDASGPDREVLSLPGQPVIDRVRCAAGTRLPCAVQVSYVEVRPGGLVDERYQNFLVDGEEGTHAAPPRRLQGRASSGAGLAGDVPVSPDGAFVALGDWRPTGRPDEPDHPRLLFYTRAGAPAASVELSKAPLHVLGWRGRGRALRAVVRAGWPSDNDPPADHLEIDPRTGSKRRLVRPPEEDLQVSPDGRYRAVCRQERAIVITERATGRERTFAIPPDDQGRLFSGCPRWASARYLAYTGTTLAGFLDAQTAKANDAFGAEVRYVKFTSDLRFAVASDGRRREMVAPVIDDAAGPR
jgi:hypothetical protein